MLFCLLIYLNLKWLISLFPENRFHHMPGLQLNFIPHCHRGTVCPKGTTFAGQHIVYIYIYAKFYMYLQICIETHVQTYMCVYIKHIMYIKNQHVHFIGIFKLLHGLILNITQGHIQIFFNKTLVSN